MAMVVTPITYTTGRLRRSTPIINQVHAFAAIADFISSLHSHALKLCSESFCQHRAVGLSATGIDTSYQACGSCGCSKFFAMLQQFLKSLFIGEAGFKHSKFHVTNSAASF